MEGNSSSDKKPPPSPMKNVGKRVRAAASKNSNPSRCFGRPLSFGKSKGKGPPLLRTESPTLESVALSKAKSRWVNGEQLMSRPSYDPPESEEIHYARRILRCNQYQETQLLYLNAELECEIKQTQKEIDTKVPPLVLEIIENQNAIGECKAKCIEMKQNISEMEAAKKLWPAISDVYSQEGEFVQQIGEISEMLDNALHLLPLAPAIHPNSDLESTEMLSLIEQMDRTFNTLQEIEEILHPTTAMVELDRSQQQHFLPSGHQRTKPIGSISPPPHGRPHQTDIVQYRSLDENRATPILEVTNLPVDEILEAGNTAQSVIGVIGSHQASLEEIGKEIEAGERVAAALCSLRLGELYHRDVCAGEIEADCEVDHFSI